MILRVVMVCRRGRHCQMVRMMVRVVVMLVMMVLVMVRVVVIGQMRSLLRLLRWRLLSPQMMSRRQTLMGGMLLLLVVMRGKMLQSAVGTVRDATGSCTSTAAGCMLLVVKLMRGKPAGTSVDVV